MSGSAAAAGCQCRCVRRVWWHVRLLYALLCTLVVLYVCSLMWLVTTRVLDDRHCAAAAAVSGQRGRADETGAAAAQPVDRRRVRRGGPRRRHQPAFYRDDSGRGATVDDDEWVWMSTYSKIPVSIFHV